MTSGAPEFACVTPVGGPAPGFGRMWEKTYTMTLEGVAPRAAIAPWRDAFPWPLPRLRQLRRRQLRRRCRGVTVLHLGADSVTASTLPTEPLAGWVTVSAQRADGFTDVRVHLLTRARDPLSALTLAFGGHHRQDRFWVGALSALAASLALPDPPVAIRGVCLDTRHQWRNLCRRPVLRTLGPTATVPALLLRLGPPTTRFHRRPGLATARHMRPGAPATQPGRRAATSLPRRLRGLLPGTGTGVRCDGGGAAAPYAWI